MGRDRELAALGRALAQAPAVVLVEGEAGIGKSRLVQEFLASAAGRRLRSLVTVCPPFRHACTLGAVTDAVRQATDGVRGLRLSALAGALRPLFPEWAAELPAALEPAEDATAARYRLFRALGELLERLRADLVVAEDVHWADETTLEFLLFLTSRMPQRVSLVVTYRPEDVPFGSLLRRLSARLQPGTTGLRLTLGPLDVSETARLMSSMLDGQHVSTEFAALVHDRTEGVPLAVEESVRLMSDRTDLARRGGGWVRRSLDDIEVPPTIRDAVLERAQRLDPDAQAVLRAAAVLADSATEAVLARVAGLGAGRIRAGLVQALGCGLLVEDRHYLVSFRHVLAGQAVYEAIRPPDRRVLHLRAGRALEDASPRPAARLARHFREAGDTSRWCTYAEQAADLALASGDEATALALLHGLVTGARLPAATMARLTRKIPFPSLTGDDRYQDLVRTLRAVLDARALEPGDEAAVRFSLGLVLETMEEYEAGRAELEEAIPHMTDDPVDAAWAMMFLGYPLGTTCPASTHLQWLRRADQLNAPMAAAERLRFTVDKASALLMLGEEEGWVEAAAIPADAPTAQARWQVTRGNLNMGEMAMMWGRYAEARRWLARALNLAEGHQYLRYQDGILVLQAHLDWLAGSWDGLAERAASVAGREDIQPQTRMEAVLVNGLLNAAVGARAHAVADLELVLAEKLKHGAVDRFAEPAAALARLRLCDGAVDDALRITDAPTRIVASKGIWVLAADLAPVRVSVLIAAGRIGEATDLVATFAGALRGRNVPAPRAALLACRAMLAEARGEQLSAAAIFARAAAAWQALPRPYDALLARERQAHCLLAARQAETAMSVLRDVLRGLHRLGATGDANRAMRTLREHGVDARRPGAGRPGYGDQLSPRELDVVRLLAAGHTDREIARTLFLSAKTVASHVNSAKRKLRAASRTALAVSVVSAGVVPASGSEAEPALRPPEFVR